MPFRARITLHEIEPLNRHIELCLISVKEQHELALARLQFQRLQATEARDAVIYVDDIIADFQIAKVRQERGRF